MNLMFQMLGAQTQKARFPNPELSPCPRDNSCVGCRGTSTVKYYERSYVSTFH